MKKLTGCVLEVGLENISYWSWMGAASLRLAVRLCRDMIFS